MALQAKYDPKEDRMIVTLRVGTSEARVFWVTRRQWMGLFHEVSALPIAQGEEQQVTEPPVRKNPPADFDLPAAVALEAVRVRRTADGVKVGFVADGAGLTLNLKEAGVLSLKGLLEQQAERAGWDPRSSLERLKAQDAARAIVRKARN